MENSDQHNKSTKLAWRLPEASERLGLSVAFLRKLMATGRLRVAKVGRTTLVLDKDLRDLLNERVGLHEVKPLSEEEKLRRRQKREERQRAHEAQAA